MQWEIKSTQICNCSQSLGQGRGCACAQVLGARWGGYGGNRAKSNESQSACLLSWREFKLAEKIFLKHTCFHPLSDLISTRKQHLMEVKTGWTPTARRSIAVAGWFCSWDIKTWGTQPLLTQPWASPISPLWTCEVKCPTNKAYYGNSWKIIGKRVMGSIQRSDWKSQHSKSHLCLQNHLIITIMIHWVPACAL